MLDSNHQLTPMVSSLSLTYDGTTIIHDPTFYSSIIGALHYVIITCP